MVEYDPIKERLSGIVKNSILLRKMMFAVLNLLFLRTWYVRRAVKRLHNERKSGLNILDAGSGFGQYSYYLAKKFKNARVTGVEIKQEHV
ncbi:class I SAM-dependent methyltransferase, partial [bacterium]|nr:class I SAM-dependent methyltransferase [bacterium]